ncbi:MAG: 4-hydroxy-tetrahydrodipicolinate synthase [Blastocatellia bacterium]|nr:4-hydroxy-tetrahydrodipicolinate synthase [Blastocatellia bacterium]
MADLSQLRGCGTAIVTPFNQDESLDELGLKRLVEFQITGGVDFIVACGTTGESVTMSEEEQARVVELCVQAARGRVPIVAGAGGYNTREIIERIHRFTDLGADAILSVVPYYNKPTQEGMYQHFRAIAENTELPIILYNIPGRCVVNMETPTTVRIAQLPNIIGTKEASGNISQIGEVIAATDESFLVFAGDDSVALPTIALGGAGVISVASNLMPKLVSDLSHACLDGDWDKARKLQRLLTPVFKTMFIESNPAPVKAAMAAAGLIGETMRLPMVPISEASRAKLMEVLVPFQVTAQAA